MTRRERLERKIEKREEWAQNRTTKAAALHRANEPYVSDYAFNTQPGHIPERARVIRREDKAFEHMGVAEHHRSKAAGLQAQIDRTIFSDDPDAIEQLEAKATACDAKAERENAINRAWRKHKGDEAALFAAWRELGCSDAMCRSLAENAREFSWSERKGPCDATYARAEARRCRERIEQIKRQNARREEAEDSGGVSIRRAESCDWCTVTFAEKPDREILSALKAAGFRWGAGSWGGPASRLPECVASLT